MALKAHRLALIGAAGLLWGTTAAAAQRGTLLAPALVTVSKSNLPSTPAVDAYYERSGDAPIWFRDAATFKAAKRLPAILDRAPLDGLSDGPELARLVESAIE